MAVGAVGLVIAMVVLALVWLYKYRIKRRYVYGLAASINKFPGRISLAPLTAFRWQKATRAEKRVSSFKALGFEPLGGYSINELPNARLFALYHSTHGLVALVNEMRELGTWSDVLLFPQGHSQPILSSNILKYGQFRLLPGDPKVHKPDATEQELIDAVRLASDRSIGAQAVTPENFPSLYEQAFADAVDARLAEPLADFEIRKLAHERGSPCCAEITENEFKLLKRMLPLAIENELRIVCASQFIRETKLPASEWQNSINRLLIVHDRTPLPRLAGHLIYGVFLTKDLKGCLKKANCGANPRESFTRLNERLSTSQRYKKIGEVTKPVPADVYRAPLERKTA